MCKKELAAFAANLCAQFNGFDQEIVDKVPYMMQCFASYENPQGCDLPENKETEQCQKFNQITGSFYEGKFSKSKVFYPRGGLETIEDYYWFSKIISGDETLLQNPNQAIANEETWWLTTIYKWMI